MKAEPERVTEGKKKSPEEVGCGGLVQVQGTLEVLCTSTSLKVPCTSAKRSYYSDQSAHLSIPSIAYTDAVRLCEKPL